MPKDTCKRTKSKTLVVFVVVILVDAMMMMRGVCCLNTITNKRGSREICQGISHSFIGKFRREMTDFDAL